MKLSAAVGGRTVIHDLSCSQTSMQVYEDLESLPVPAIPAVVAIGAFDGIHLGHRAIISIAVADAHASGLQASVFTFDRHPAELLRPDRAPDYITTPEQRVELIESLGADCLVIAKFDTVLAELDPETFVTEILVKRLGAKAIVVGQDFRFGKRRAGDVAFLQSRGKELGFEVNALDPVESGEGVVSSTRIRELLASGEIAAAEQALGHPFKLAGQVVTGRQLGRTLGFPTANLERSFRQVVPKQGIWAVRVSLEDGRVLDGACSIGVRPTVEDAGARTIETFILNFNEDIYHTVIELQFVEYLRAEAKFASLDALVQQMNIDVARARTVLTPGSLCPREE